MRCRCFWPFLTIAIDAIIFAQPLGPIVFRWFFQFQNRCLKMIFCGKPKNSVFYDMLKFATNCAYISALGVKGEKFTINEHKLWINNEFLQNLWLDCFSYALGSNKGRQITTIVKDWWFSMSQSQSVRLFLLNHWDRLFSDGFQIKNNR